jgi:glycogen synthase
VTGILDRALGLYQDKKSFFRIRKHAMEKKNGWEERTGEYLRIYRGVHASAPGTNQDLLMARMALKM